MGGGRPSAFPSFRARTWQLVPSAQSSPQGEVSLPPLPPPQGWGVPGPPPSPSRRRCSTSRPPTSPSAGYGRALRSPPLAGEAPPVSQRGGGAQREKTHAPSLTLPFPSPLGSAVSPRPAPTSPTRFLSPLCQVLTGVWEGLIFFFFLPGESPGGSSSEGGPQPGRATPPPLRAPPAPATAAGRAGAGAGHGTV